jgi:uracil-DNA glycosylase
MRRKTMAYQRKSDIFDSVLAHLEAERDWGIEDLPVTERVGTATDLSAQAALDAVRAEIGDCTRCPLHKGRTNLVFGVGNPQARLMFIGEGPGRDEDEQGEPFVGRAGQLLTKIIQAMGLQRSDVYIANIVNCRPPNNRNPEPVEMQTCSPFLIKQIEAIKPEAMVALGNIAVQTLLDTSVGITRLRGRFHDYQGVPLMPTFHPAFLLRDPHKKKEVWQDMQLVMKKLGLTVNSTN